MTWSCMVLWTDHIPTDSRIK